MYVHTLACPLHYGLLYMHLYMRLANIPNSFRSTGRIIYPMSKQYRSLSVTPARPFNEISILFLYFHSDINTIQFGYVIWISQYSQVILLTLRRRKKTLLPARKLLVQIDYAAVPRFPLFDRVFSASCVLCLAAARHVVTCLILYTICSRAYH